MTKVYFNGDDGSDTTAHSPMIATASLSTVGFIGGLFYANKQGCGFWGYVGYAIIGNATDGIVGAVIDKTILLKK